MDVTDLVEFIRARLDEDEAHARKDLWIIERATPLGQWKVAYGYNLPYSILGEDGSIGRLTSSHGRPLADGEDDLHQADAMLVGRLVRRSARHAARVLREVEAKRRMLGYLVDLEDRATDNNWWSLDTDLPFKLLAMSWNAHPDYRTEWSPS